MSVKETFIMTYVCDKCGHRWLPKKEHTIEGINLKEVNEKEEDLVKNLKTPKICPKCKTKKWNIEGLKKTKTFRTKRKEVLKTIDKLKKELAFHNRALASTQNMIDAGNTYLKELEEGLKVN